ncbi:hypothetical protein [Catenulispora rubra]|uniref:hypothetical protein n=1 Tax=Catenulispora rubra TaxID=280293 RepID=UPI0018926015|nr:hypothetical protein [Catenulispora rubra]
MRATAIDTLTEVLLMGSGPLSWAHGEIKAAIQRHPDKADELRSSVHLLKVTHERMETEFVFRGHAREILERVAAGADTRPGTAAEVVLAASQASKLAPMHDVGNGLMGRMWAQAFPDHPVLADRQQHHEGLDRPQIDDLEALIRKRTAKDWRYPH